jgi:tetratricopeptide (TPR) repeat protein
MENQPNASQQSDPSVPPPRRTSLRQVFGWVFLATGVLLAAWTAYGGWRRVTATPPPEVDLSHAEAPVVEAVEAARRQVRARPHAADAWGELALVLLAHDFYEPARSCFAQAERLDPTDPRWPYLGGCCGLMLGSEDTIACLRRAVPLGEREPTPRLRLGEALFEQGLLDEAEEQFRHVLQRDADHPRAHLGLGRVLHARGDLRASLDHLQRFLARAPQVKSGRGLLAEVYDRLGERDKADEQRRQTARTEVDLPWPDPYLAEVDARVVGFTALARRASRLRQRGLSDQAEAALRKLVADQPYSAKARLELGKHLVRAGKGPAAEQELRRALALEPTLDGLPHQLAGALILQQKYREAATWLRTLLEKEPALALAHTDLAGCLIHLGDRAGAIRALREAVRHKPDLAGAHKHLGLQLAANQQYAEAIRHLRQAVLLNPADEDTKRQLDQIARDHPTASPP